MGLRPRLACEVRAEGVVAARSDDASATLTAVARAPLGEGFVAPQWLGPDGAANGQGAAAGRARLVAALRSALEGVGQKARDVTVVVPDAAVRVLLLDFDELPAKAAEALPVVRFRLKKLLPFDSDTAAVSYQVMSSVRGTVQVLAVAMPAEVLAEYEAAVREAGYEAGAVLPSTLAVLAGVAEAEKPVLVVNAGGDAVTTAIVKGSVLLLHRTVDLGANAAVSATTAELKEPEAGKAGEGSISAIAARLAAGAARAQPTGADGAAGWPAGEVVQAVSVAAAYFEDTLETVPGAMLSAGTLGAEALSRLLDEAYVGPYAVEEIVDRQMLGIGAGTAGLGGVPLGWLAGVRGALAS